MKLHNIIAKLDTLKEFFLNLILPEGERIKSLLKYSPSSMRALLPESTVRMSEVFVLFEYGNRDVKFIIKSIKYKNNFSLKKRIAIYLADEIREICSELSLFSGKAPIIVPMPMSKNEFKNRGWNQSEELTREVEKILGSSYRFDYNLLNKFRETERQTTLTREERLLNVHESMAASDRAKGENIILIDDVYTTLATFYEARRALLDVGAHKVFGLFLAH